MPSRAIHVVLLALCLGILACGAPDPDTQREDVTELAFDGTVVGELAFGQTYVGDMDPRAALAFLADEGDVVSAFAATLPRGQDAPSVALFGPLDDDDRGPRRALASGHLIDHAVDVSGRYALRIDAVGPARVRLACSGGACAPTPLATPPADETCGLSVLGGAVLDAAMAAEQSRNTVPPEAMVTYDNLVHDARLAGPAIFPAMADAIAEAEHEVDIAMFVLSQSDAYEEMLDGLARLASRRASADSDQPVVVRLVIDAQEAFFNTGPEIANGAFAGIASLDLDPDHVQVFVATYEHLALGNLHTKSVIVDGRVAMLGGANIQHQHDYAAPWLDSFYALEGGAAQTLLADFDHAWTKARKWHCDVAAPAAEDGAWCVRWEDAPPIWHPVAVLGPPLEGASSCAPTIALNRTAWGGFNNNVDNPMAQGLLAAMDHAQDRIRIQTPNLNDDAVRDALVAAVARGVEVEIVLSLGFNERAMALFGGGNAAVAADLRARVLSEAAGQAHRLQIRFYSADGVTPVDGNGPGASHLKYMSVDGQLVVVGSTNMDTIAWNHSRETNLAFDSAIVTQAWDTQVFEPSFARGVSAW